MLKLITLLCDDFPVKVQYLSAISKPLLILNKEFSWRTRLYTHQNSV